MTYQPDRTPPVPPTGGPAGDRTIEQRLADSQAALHDAQRLAGLGSWEWFPETDIVQWSHGLYLILGLDPAVTPPPYAAHARLYTPESWTRLNAAVQRTLEDGTPYELELELVRPDGARRLVHVRGEALRDNSGRTVRLRGTLLDVTERRHADEAIRESEERYRSLVTAMAEGVVAHRADGTIFAVNASAERILGMLERDVVGLASNDPVWQAVHHDGSPFGLDEHPAIVTLKTGRPCAGVVMGIRRSNGERRWISINTEPLRRPGAGVPYGAVSSFSDITEQVERQDALRQSEDRLRLLVSATFEGIVFTENGVVVDVSDQMAAMAGWDRSDLIGRPVQTLIAPEGHERLQKALREDQLDPYENLAIRKDGSIFPVEIHARWMTVGDRAVRVAAVRDLTGAKQLEHSLRAAKEYAERLVETANAMVLGLDTEGRVTEFNEAAERVTGYTRAELVGQSWFDRVVPRDRYPDVWEEFARLRLEGTVPRYFENPIVAKDGTERYIVWQNSELREDGRLLGFISFGIDVTDRKRAEDALRESEERARALYERLPIPTFVWRRRDGEFVLDDCNLSARALFPDAGGHVGRPIRELSGTLAGIATDLADCFAGQRSSKRTIEVDEGSGGPRIFEVTGGYVPPDLVLCHVEDVTEQQRTDEQLRVSQRLETVGQLAGGIAHDFNNLLTVIQSYIQIALDDAAENDGLKADLKKVEAAAQRAVALTRQLLVFSRKQVLNARVLNLNAIVASMEPMLRRLIGEDVDLITTTDAERPFVKADPWQIEQVIMNLVVNARDAMPRGGTLTIATENVILGESGIAGPAVLTGGAYVRLSVVDTGCGMDERTQRRIFEPFFTTKGLGRGTGLGLATVYGIVTQSGGAIAVDSESGRGSQFHVLLPLDRSAAVAEPGASGPAEVSRGRETILVVEDEPPVREVVVTSLRKAGYRILAVANGREALAECSRPGATIDLVLTDVVMPEMSGKQLADELARRYPDLRVLFMSGYTEDAIVSHGVDEGAEQIIGKPFAPRELTQKIREILDRPSRRR